MLEQRDSSRVSEKQRTINARTIRNCSSAANLCTSGYPAAANEAANDFWVGSTVQCADVCRQQGLVSSSWKHIEIR